MVLSNRLPEEVVIDILSRSSVESLTRFKCVRKSWYDLIEDSEFVAMQLLRYNLKNKDTLQILLLCARESSDGGEHATNMLSLLKYDGGGEVVSSTTMKDVNLSVYEKDVDSSVYRQDAGYTIWCSCDGIVCFDDYDGGNVIIANPGIRQYRALPNSCIPLPEAEAWGSEFEYSIRTHALGLGIDLQTKDYKVVRILQILDCFNSPTYLDEDSCDVEVYSLSTNSWRQIRDSYLFEFRILFHWESSYWNGAYYWCASKESSVMDGLCCFKFTDEEFHFISVPEHIFLFPNGTSVIWCGIIEFNGALALVTHYGSAEIGSCFDVWVDGGGDGTWTKVLSSTKPLLMDFQVNAPRWLLVNNKDQQLIFILSNGQPASYSFVTDQVKILPVNRESRCYSTAIYKTSLVQIKSTNDDDDD